MSSRTTGKSPETTMMIKAPTFAKSGRAWRPFVFSNLEKVSKRHAQLVRNLEWMLPNVRSTGEVSSAVRKRLQEMLEEQVSLSAEYVHVVPMTQLRVESLSGVVFSVTTPRRRRGACRWRCETRL